MKTAVILYLLLALTGCGLDKAKQDNSYYTSEDDTISWDVSEINLNILLLPPSDLMIFIKDMQLKPGLIHTIDSVSGYSTTRSKCIILGVYMADMVYLGLQNDKHKAHNYLKNVRELSNDLRIYGVFTNEFAKRIGSQLNNPDSLYLFSRTIQENFVSTLDLSNRQNILALISLGIFIESLYLVVSNMEEYEDFSEISAEILNQKIIFDQYYSYANYFFNDHKVSTTVAEIEPLKSFFNDLELIETQKDITKDSTHHYTLSGGYHLDLTEEDFEELKNIITVVRKQLIRM